VALHVVRRPKQSWQVRSCQTRPYLACSARTCAAGPHGRQGATAPTAPTPGNPQACSNCVTHTLQARYQPPPPPPTHLQLVEVEEGGARRGLKPAQHVGRVARVHLAVIPHACGNHICSGRRQAGTSGNAPQHTRQCPTAHQAMSHSAEQMRRACHQRMCLHCPPHCHTATGNPAPVLSMRWRHPEYGAIFCPCWAACPAWPRSPAPCQWPAAGLTDSSEAHNVAELLPGCQGGAGLHQLLHTCRRQPAAHAWQRLTSSPGQAP